MAKAAAKPRDDAPGLFGPDPDAGPPPSASPYPAAEAARRRAQARRQRGLSQEVKVRLRPVVARLAAEVMAPTWDAIERAIAQLEAAIADPEADGARVVTAREVLRSALEAAGRRPAGDGTTGAA